MKQTNHSTIKQLAKGKVLSPQGVKRTTRSIKLPLLEAEMNIQILTAISAIGLGIMVFLAQRFSRSVARQPILIEQRRIEYKRRR